MEIKEINHGIAYRDGDIIYVNSVLLKDQKVYIEVLNHEFMHEGGAYSLSDLCLDLKPCSVRTTLFCLSHPSTWTAVLPIVRVYGEWGVDLATCISVAVAFILGGALCYLIF